MDKLACNNDDDLGNNNPEQKQLAPDKAEAKKQNAVMQLFEHIGSEIFRWFPVFMLGTTFGIAISAFYFLP